MDQETAVVVLVAEGARPPRGLDQIQRLAEVRVVAGTEALADALADATALFMWDFGSSLLRDAWPNAPRLRWIHAASTGVDAIPIDQAAASDVTVTNTRGIFERPIAEYVLALLLLFAKDLHTTLSLQRERDWRHRETGLIAGQRLLVVGAGPIGREIAGLARAAGLEVAVVGRRPRDAEPGLGRVYGADQLDERLGEADAVVLAVPLTEETRGLMDAGRLSRMRPESLLINVGRGPLVEETALLDALRSGHLGGAALDVFETEPLPSDHQFWTMSQVVVSPHMSGDRVGWEEAVVELFAANLRRFLAGEPLMHTVEGQAAAVTEALQ